MRHGETRENQGKQNIVEDFFSTIADEAASDGGTEISKMQLIR